MPVCNRRRKLNTTKEIYKDSVLYFDPKTKSPITLLEMGLHATDERVVVCCPEGFFRKGNVDIVCKRYDIKMTETYDELLKYLTKELK